MPGRRSTPEEIAEKKASLLAILEGSARNGHVCPGLGRLAVLLRLGTGTIHDLLNSLRNDKAITWEIVGSMNGKTRVVTITSSGATTARPKYASRPAPKADPVTFTGPPVRFLDGVEFLKRKNELEKRDSAERARPSA